MTTILILGATGFIGGHIGLAALERGWTVRALRRNPDPTGPLATAPVEWFSGSLDAPESLDQPLRSVDFVFHAAAYYPKDGRHVSRQVAFAVKQTRNVLDALHRAGSPKLLFTSSLSTIGRPALGEARLADERDTYIPGSLPRSAYYECKIAMEREILQAAVGTQAVVLNPTAVFGPGDWKPTTGGLLIGIARGYGLVSLPGWTNVVDVRDVARAHLRAAEVGVSGERYVLGGHNLRIAEFIRSIAEAARVRPPLFELPRSVLRALVRIGERLPGASALGNHLGAFETWQPLDSSKARRALGLDPRPWADTLRDSLEWYRGRGLLPREGSVV